MRTAVALNLCFEIGMIVAWQLARFCIGIPGFLIWGRSGPIVGTNKSGFWVGSDVAALFLVTVKAT